MNTDLFQSSGHSPVLQIWLHIFVIVFITASSPSFISSIGIPSSPGALLSFSCLIAHSTSASIIVGSFSNSSSSFMFSFTTRTRVKEIIQDAAEKYVPKKLARKTTPWLSEEAIMVATERREAKKTGNKERVKVLNRTFQKKAREDKENHLNEMCRELEEDGKKGRTKEMFAKIKKITKTAAPRMGSLKTKDGKIIGDEDGIK